MIELLGGVEDGGGIFRPMVVGLNRCGVTALPRHSHCHLCAHLVAIKTVAIDDSLGPQYYVPAKKS
jgi:hypothetical protein